MTDLMWKTEKRKISALVPHSSNPRQMTEAEAARLTESIEKFNLVEIPAIDVDDTILAGHQRLKVMQLLGRGEETIDVRVPSRKLTEDERIEYLIRSNKNVGSWDYGLLANFDEGMLLRIGFEDMELMEAFGLQDSEGTEVDPDRVRALTVLPPEAPNLRERAEVHFESKKDYDRVKKAVEGGKITAADILKLC